jgi:enediyne biosynthesis protein E4
MHVLWLALALATPRADATHPCAACHPQEVQTYKLTGMGQSVGSPAGHPAGAVAHSLSGTRFTVTADSTGMRHRLERAAEIAEYPIELFIGSGRQGRSYAARAGDHLVQSPVSYYTHRQAWDLSPGYESDRAPGFRRRITDECLFCHTSGDAAAPRPIDCERCHGPTAEHLARPSAETIVNPRRLPAAARDSVCEQCHLGGEARIPNPGRLFRDFVAGRTLEEIFSVYVGERPGPFKVTSHSEQLALSRCAQASGNRFWCGTCHNPHDPSANPFETYRARCTGCHASLSPSHPQPASDCASCHMPKRGTEVAHTAYTDHRIRRVPEAAPATPGPVRLRAWRDPPREQAARNLGLAYVSMGERDGSAFHLNEGFRLLSALREPDADVQTALGLVLMKRNNTVDAARHFEKALAEKPSEPARLLNLAAALRGGGDSAGAAVYLLRALERDPLLDEARQLLEGMPERERAVALYREKKFAEAARAFARHLEHHADDFAGRLLYGLSLQQAGQLELAEKVLRDAAERRPRDAPAHVYLGRVQYLRGLLDEAERSARRALELGEPPARAHNLLALILVETNRNQQALAEYEAALRADPHFFDAHLNAGVLLLRLGRRDEALARLKAAVEQNPASAEARYHRGRALVEAGRLPEAASDLKAAGPYEPARRLLAQIRSDGIAKSPSGPSRGAVPIRFRNVAAEAGLRFTLENHGTPEKRLIETMAGGVAALDYNNDGRVDIFFTNGAAIPSLEKESSKYWNRLYRNDGGLKFTDVTETARVAGRGYSMGAAAGDFDNDGFTDLFVAGVNRNILYRNRGDGTFEDVTERAGIKSDYWSVAAGWFDYDNDGRLDLFIVNYLKWSAASEPLCLDPAGKLRVYCHPDRYDPLPNTLYRNRGDGSFEDVSVKSGIAAHAGKGMSVAFADYDGDGRMDSFVTNDTVPNFLFRNRGDGTFDETGLPAGVAVNDDGQAISSMGADFRDYDGDGLPDIIITALSGETFPVFRNQGKGFFRDATYPSRVGLLSYEQSGWSVALFDFNNDGWKDIFSANSHVSDHMDRYRQPNSVFANAGNGTFEEATSGELLLARAPHRGAAFADFNNDGRIDVVVSALGGPAELWKNESDEHNRWLVLQLEGRRSNRQALGARVRIGGRHNQATTSVGYASSSPASIHFGLGELETAHEIEIRWPSGAVQVLTKVPANQVLQVREP